MSLELTCLIQVHHAVNSPIGIEVLWTASGQNGATSLRLNATEYEPYLWKSTFVTSHLINTGTFTCSPIPVAMILIPSDSVAQELYITISELY